VEGTDRLGDAALWRGVVDASPDAVLLVDEEGLIVSANSHCLEVFDTHPDELVGRPVEALVPAAVRQHHPRRRASFEGVHGGRPMGLLQLAAARADGSEFPAEISLAKVSTEDATYVCATVRDVSSRVLEQERFRSLLEAAPDAMVIVDESAEIVLVNRQVVNLFGYEPDELLGRPIETLVPERYREGHHALREGFLGRPGVRPMGSGRELYAARKDGSEFPVEISLSPLLTEEGILVSAAVRDITERLRLQREADRLRDELVATVSHELRTPLTSIIGYVELMMDLDEDAISAPARRMLEVIERNASRELRLVNDLLDLSSIDVTTVEEPQRVSLGSVARSCAEGAGVAALTKSVPVSVQVPPGLVVEGDPLRLAQVVDNLVVNALKFSSPGTEVVVAGGREGGDVWLEVRDRGTGVSEEELPRIFDRLFRSADAVRDQVPGAGLGLTIARAIVDAHRGRITATSTLGEGTTVRVVLPEAPSEIEETG